MKKITKILIILLMVLIGMGMLGIGSGAEETEELFLAMQAIQFDEPVEIPELSLPLVGGETRKLSDFKGSVVLLNFWATWCGYCEKERPSLQALYEKYQKKGLVIVAVSIDRAAIETVEKYLKEHELTFPTLHDQDSSVAGDFGVRGVPSTYFIDASGKALGGVIGPRDWDTKEGRALIEFLLSQKK